MTDLDYRVLYFEEPVAGTPPAGTTVTTDIQPAVSVVHTNMLARNLDKIREVISANNINYVDYGDTITMYKSKIEKVSSLVPEGVDIPMSKADRKPAGEVKLTLRKRGALVTAEAVIRSGEEYAINETDRNLTAQVQDDIFNDWITALTGAAGTAGKTATDLKGGMAYARDAANKYFSHRSFTPLYVISSSDLADYQANHDVTLETQSGLQYMENFLATGGTTLVLPELNAGKVFCTAKENVFLATLSRSNVLSSLFGMTPDELGLVYMAHKGWLDNLSYKVIMAWRTAFYFEEPAGVCYSTIGTAG